MKCKLLKNGTCFTGDTLVYTKKGYLPIKNIRAGDDIYSREERTGETGFQKVEEVFLRSVHTIYTIEVNTTAKIQTTSGHPFYVEGEGWVIANQLQVGMNLQTINGTAVITDLRKERTEEEIPVYNFRVSGWSSYFVSEWNVYVHNGNGYKRKTGAAGIPLRNIPDASGEITYSKLMHALRESNSIEGNAVAKLLKRGKINVLVADRFNDGRGGAYFIHSRNIYIYKQVKLPSGEWVMQSSNSAAGFLAHETKHWIDREVKTKMDEFNAYMWQKRVDLNLKYTSDDIWRILEEHPAYKHLKE